MNNAALLVIFFGVLSSTPNLNAEDRPTIESLVGTEIAIDDGWAGQSITIQKKMKKMDASYTVFWKRFGSGVPVIETKEFEAKLNSDFKITFVISREEEKKSNEMMVTVGDSGEFKVYLDGIRIVASKRTVVFPKDVR